MTHDADTVICSARGCHQQAVWMLEWRNPRLHSVDRRKHWATCDSHKDSLSGFLTSRNFPCRILTMDEYIARATETTC
ncbi:hypothetical protein [Salininema proteolyticum]|uniref:Acetone carboxylase n=1 Tax=Salininema proteolyticum TaxID=1607685 RepID=A0ABV8U4C6_9ACTN